MSIELLLSKSSVLFFLFKKKKAFMLLFQICPGLALHAERTLQIKRNVRVMRMDYSAGRNAVHSIGPFCTVPFRLILRMSIPQCVARKNVFCVLLKFK